MTVGLTVKCQLCFWNHSHRFIHLENCELLSVFSSRYRLKGYHFHRFFPLIAVIIIMHQRAYVKGGFNWTMPPPKGQPGKSSVSSPCCDRVSNPLFVLILILSTFLAVSAGVLSISEYWASEMKTGSSFRSLACGLSGALGGDLGDSPPKGWEFFKGLEVLLVSHELSFSEPSQLLMELSSLLVASDARVSWITNQKETPGEHMEIEQRLETKLTTMKLQVFEAKSEEASKLLVTVDLVVLSSVLAGRFLDGIDAPDLLTSVLRKTVWWLPEQKPQQLTHTLLRHLPKVATVVVDSKFLKGFWIDTVKETISQTLSKVQIVPPSISRQAAQVAENPVAHIQLGRFVRKTLNLEEDAFVVSVIGASARAAGQDFFLRAFKLAVDSCRDKDEATAHRMQALLAGSDWENQPKLEAELRQLVKSNSLSTSVVFVNQTNNVVPYLAASDILVQNGQAQGEVSLRTTVEAMAFRLPILATTVPDMSAAVTNKANGLLHPVGKEGIMALGASICELAINRKLSSNLGDKGFEKVQETHLVHHFTERFGKIMKGVVDAKGKEDVAKTTKSKKGTMLVTEVVR